MCCGGRKWLFFGRRRQLLYREERLGGWVTEPAMIAKMTANKPRSEHLTLLCPSLAPPINQVVAEAWAKNDRNDSSTDMHAHTLCSLGSFTAQNCPTTDTYLSRFCP